MLIYYLSLLADPSDAPMMTEMYNLYNENLRKYARALLHNQDDAEDAAQTTWERVAVHFATAKEYYLESQKSFFSYIITIVKNLSTDERKKEGE